IKTTTQITKTDNDPNGSCSEHVADYSWAATGPSAAGPRFRPPPDVAEHDGAASGSERNRQDAPQDASQQRGAQHEGDDDGQRVQSDTVAHDLGLNDEPFQGLHDREDRKHTDRTLPSGILSESDDERRGASGNGAEEGNHGQHRGHHAEQNRVGEPDNQKANGVQDAVANGDEHLAAKEDNEAVIAGFQDEDQFVLGLRVRYRKIVGPLRLDP